MMKHVHKIDGRHSGYGQWTYYVKRPNPYSYFNSNNKISTYQAQQQFHSWFAWCWETWGPSKTLKLWYKDLDHNKVLNPDAVSHNEHWCWEMDENQERIFFRTDKEFSLFLLRWE